MSEVLIAKAACLAMVRTQCPIPHLVDLLCVVHSLFIRHVLACPLLLDFQSPSRLYTSKLFQCFAGLVADNASGSESAEPLSLRPRRARKSPEDDRMMVNVDFLPLQSFFVL